MTITNLNQCERLYELRDFVNELKVDTTSGGRKFVYAKESYSMNQLIQRLEICAKASITNTDILREVGTKIQQLNKDSKAHVEKNGSFYKIRAALGNAWFWLANLGFNKEETWAYVLKNYAQIARKDLNKLNINSVTSGQTPLASLVRNPLPYDQLAQEAKEMLANGANPNLVGSNGKSFLDEVFAYAEEQKDGAILITFLPLVKREDLIQAVIKHHTSCSLDNNLKFVIMKRLGDEFPVLNLRSCLPKEFLEKFSAHYSAKS